MLDHAGRRGEAGGQLRRLAHRAQVVGDQPAVGARRHVAQLGLADAGERGSHAVGEELERHRRADRLHELVGGGDDHEAVGRGRHDLLPRVRRAAALDEPAVRRDLVGPVDGQVEAVELVEGLDRQSQLACSALRLQRGGDAAEAQAAACERREEVRHRGACAQPDEHPVPDELGSRLGGDALFVVGGHAVSVGSREDVLRHRARREGRARHGRRARDRPRDRARARRRRGAGRRGRAHAGAGGGDRRRNRRHRDRGRRLRPRRRRADGRHGRAGARAARRSRRQRRHRDLGGERLGGRAGGVVADPRGQRAGRLPLLPRRHPGDDRARRRPDRQRRERRRLPAGQHFDGLQRQQGGGAPLQRDAREPARAARHPCLLHQPRPRAHGADREPLRRRRALDAARAGAAPRPGARRGRLDALSGRYLHAEHDDIDDVASRADQIVADDLNAIRLRR